MSESELAFWLLSLKTFYDFLCNLHNVLQLSRVVREWSTKSVADIASPPAGPLAILPWRAAIHVIQAVTVHTACTWVKQANVSNYKTAVVTTKARCTNRARPFKGTPTHGTELRHLASQKLFVTRSSSHFSFCSTCKNGKMTCETRQDTESCDAPFVYVDCTGKGSKGVSCQETCQSSQIFCTSSREQCVAGCACPEGAVLGKIRFHTFHRFCPRYQKDN